MRFAEARHRLVLSNIANADTPGYRRLDLDQPRFQRLLSQAIDERATSHPGRFVMRHTLHVPMDDRGHYLPRRWNPFGKHEGPLRHDDSNVSMEREMALMAQNTGFYNRSAALLRKSLGQIRAAITERPGEG